MRVTGRVVLDASVVVEAVGYFAYPDQARAILRAAASGPGIDLWAPDLVFPESASAIRRLLYRGEIDRSAADFAIESIVQLPVLVAATAGLVEAAWQLRDNVSLYDACYVVLARELRATLVTADGPLARVMRSENVVHLSDIG